MKTKLKKFIEYYLIFCIYALIGWLYEVLWMRFVVSPHKWINRGVLIGPFLPIYGFGMLLLYVLLWKTMQKKHPITNINYRLIALTTFTTFIYTTIVEYTTPKIYNVIDYFKNYGLGLIIINIVVFTIVSIIISKSKDKELKNYNLTVILIFLVIWIIATVIEYLSHFVMDKYFHIILWDYTKDFLNVNKRINWDASRNFAIGGTFLLYIVQPFINKLLKILKETQKTNIALILGIPMIFDFVFHVILKII